MPERVGTPITAVDGYPDQMNEVWHNVRGRETRNHQMPPNPLKMGCDLFAPSLYLLPGTFFVGNTGVLALGHRHYYRGAITLVRHDEVRDFGVESFALHAAKPPQPVGVLFAVFVNQIPASSIVVLQNTVAGRARDGFGPRRNKHNNWGSHSTLYRDTMTMLNFSMPRAHTRGFFFLRI